MNNPTKPEEILAYNKKWDERVKDQFSVPEKSPEQIEYEKKVLNLERKVYSREEAKKAIFDKIVSITLKPKEEVYKIIKNDPDYQESLSLLVDLIFGFENEKLKGKGGIYFCSEPGVGKTTIMGAGCNVAAILYQITQNPNIVKWQNMVNDISLKLKGNNDVDLTYNLESHLFLDELTEKINQVSHYGDYKYSINEIIQIRYDKWKSQGLWTIIGSNLFADNENLFSMIDKRSQDRFKEQYLVIELLGNNKRTI